MVFLAEDILALENLETPPPVKLDIAEIPDTAVMMDDLLALSLETFCWSGATISSSG